MKVKIEFEVELDEVEHTEEELEEYLRYTFRDNGSMSGINPFYGQQEPEPIFGTIEWEYL